MTQPTACPWHLEAWKDAARAEATAPIGDRPAAEAKERRAADALDRCLAGACRGPVR